MRFEDLPADLKREVLKQISKEDAKQCEEKQEKRTKYNSQKAECGNIKFDSMKEARRFDELMVLLEAGEISNLKLQPQFTLLEGYMLPDGSRVKRMHYTADFSYIQDGKLIVEDVKSRATRTEAYQMRKNLMKDRYGIDIMEI